MPGIRKQRSGLLLSFISFEAGSFEYEGKHYPYENVRHVGRYARRTSLNFLPVGDYVRIQIWVEGSPKPITLQNTFGLVGTTGFLEDTYKQLVERTRHVRLRQYLQGVERDGYFEYDHAKFFSSGHAVYGSTRLNVKSSSISTMPFCVMFSEGHGAAERSLTVSTVVDEDVFYVLLEMLYGRQVA